MTHADRVLTALAQKRAELSITDIIKATGLARAQIDAALRELAIRAAVTRTVTWSSEMIVTRWSAIRISQGATS